MKSSGSQWTFFPTIEALLVIERIIHELGCTGALLLTVPLQRIHGSWSFGGKESSSLSPVLKIRTQMEFVIVWEMTMLTMPVRLIPKSWQRQRAQLVNISTSCLIASTPCKPDDKIYPPLSRISRTLAQKLQFLVCLRPRNCNFWFACLDFWKIVNEFVFWLKLHHCVKLACSSCQFIYFCFHKQLQCEINIRNL